MGNFLSSDTVYIFHSILNQTKYSQLRGFLSYMIIDHEVEFSLKFGIDNDTEI